MTEAGTPVGEPSAPTVEQTRQFDLPARSAEQAAGAMEESVPEKEQPASDGTPESEETTPFSIFGFGAKELPEDEQLPEDEEEDEEEEQEEEEEEPIEDYDSPSDAPTVQADLKSLKMTLGLRFVATAILGVLSLYLSLTASLTGLPRPAFLDPGSNPLAFLMTSGLMLLVAMLVNYNTIAAGALLALVRPEPGSAAHRCGARSADPVHPADHRSAAVCGVRLHPFFGGCGALPRGEYLRQMHHRPDGGRELRDGERRF